MSEDGKKDGKVRLNEGYRPVTKDGAPEMPKGFVPGRSGETIAMDGFKTAANAQSVKPPKTVPNLTSSVRPPPAGGKPPSTGEK